MVKKRRYQQLCHIARGLNHIGDRWALLILRDLLAGPARFGDLQVGLTGIATNLLTTRLQELQESGLVRQRKADYGVQLYELTALGQASEPLLQALAEFGARFAPEDQPKPPGNLRLLCVPLKAMFQRVVEKDACLEVELRIQEEPFAMRVQQGRVELAMGSLPSASVVLELPLESVLAWMDGQPDTSASLDATVRVIQADGADRELVMNWIARVPARAPLQAGKTALS